MGRGVRARRERSARADGPRQFFENDLFFMRQLLRIPRNLARNTMCNSLTRMVQAALDHSSLVAIPLDHDALLSSRHGLIPAILCNDLAQTAANTAALRPELEQAHQSPFTSADAGKHGK